MATLVDASSARPVTGGIEVAPSTPGAEFRSSPAKYRHWRLAVDGPVAILTMDVNRQGAPSARVRADAEPLRPSVDIEVYDAVQRLRFEHRDKAGSRREDSLRSSRSTASG
jgi:benzoyl-CoA-dihydrodiol lyase